MNRTRFSFTGIGCAAIALLASGCAGSASGQTDSVDEGTAATGSTGNEQQAWTERLVDAPSKPEDLIALPGTDSLIISGMSADPGKDGGAGHLYLMDKNTEELTEIWPERKHATELNEELYSACPAPPELDIASPHGIGLEEQEDGSSRLYVVNHGGRESVEIFSLEPSPGKGAEVTWIGCELLPEGTFGNGVVPDPASDGFYVTHYFDPANMMAGFETAFAGDDTGYVLHSDSPAGWQKVPGSEMSAPNGIAVSADGADLYVAGWGSRDLRKFATDGNNEEPEVLKLDFMPDNLRWTAEGTLLVTGQDIDSFKTFQGFQTGEVAPEPGFDVMEIDPDGFTAEEIASGTSEGFTNPTTAVEVDGDILIGSVDGDKIMRLTKP
jgi:hypothetical protein